MGSECILKQLLMGLKMITRDCIRHIKYHILTYEIKRPTSTVGLYVCALILNNNFNLMLKINFVI